MRKETCLDLSIFQTKQGLWLDGRTESKELAEAFRLFLVNIKGDENFVNRHCIACWNQTQYGFNFPLHIIEREVDETI